MQVVATVVTFNSENVIEACLRGLVSEKIGRIIVVDNASTDKTIALVKKRFPQVEILRLGHNLGYAGGNNRGIELALKSGPDYVLILNPDVAIFPGAIEKLIVGAKKYANQGIFGPKILQAGRKTIWSIGGELDKKRWTAKLIGYNQIDKTHRFPGISTSGVSRSDTPEVSGVIHGGTYGCDFISGTCMLIPKQLLETGLRFYEPYFMYYEDIEFCVRAGKLGFPSYIVPQSKIIHFETSQMNSVLSLSGGILGKDYYLARNHLLFVERNAPIKVKLREALRLPKTIWEHVNAKGDLGRKGIKDYYLRRFGHIN